MSLLEKLFGGLFGEEEEEQQQIEHPCSNCPSSCTIAPDACQVCSPFKEQMIDAIYRVEHKEEIISQYEVVGTNAQEGTIICPNCGGHSENHYVCDYCGSKLQDGSGKIQVASAADIPNPVLDAQDIIFRRYDAVKGYAGNDSGYGYEDALSGIGSQGLFSSIFDALLGTESSSSEAKSIGKKMTEGEIEEMAKYYGVSVSEYLTGLDNGKYLTLSNKAAAAQAEEKYAKAKQAQQYQSGSGMGDLAGLAGAMGLGSMLFGGSTYNQAAARDPRQKYPGRPPMPMNQGYHTSSNTGSHVSNSAAADPKLKNAASGNDMRASRVKKEAQEREAEKARKEALAKREEQLRKEAQAQKAEQARKEAQALKAQQLRKEEQARRKEEQARKQAAAGGDRFDAGPLSGSGRKPAPAPKAASSGKSDRVDAKPQSMKGYSELKKDPNAKAPGSASGMGKRPGRP